MPTPQSHFARKRAYFAALLAGTTPLATAPQWAQVALVLAQQGPQSRQALQTLCGLPRTSMTSVMQTACIYGVVERVGKGRYHYRPVD